jgi:hypothetical protein
MNMISKLFVRFIGLERERERERERGRKEYKKGPIQIQKK